MVARFDAARAEFPSGLLQPEGSFRFSLDALLLAAFALRRLPAGEDFVHLVDLGCGCGVVGLACLLGRERATAAGLDREAELIAAARENALRLGVADRFSARSCDFTNRKDRALLERETADVVLANMPYRAEGMGRPPRSPMRRRALFAEASTVPGFMLAAKAAVKPDGVFSLVYPWAGRESLFASLEFHGFFPESILPVCTSRGKRALCLVSSRRMPVTARILAPLTLRRETGEGYTADARSFCPWLEKLRVKGGS